MISKRVVRDVVLRSVGLEWSARPPTLVRHGEWAVGNVLELAIAYALAQRRELTVIQVGAFTGGSADPLRALVRKYHLQGIVVEPEPRAFAVLTQVYADTPHMKPVNVAVAESEGVRTLYSFAGKHIPQSSLHRSHLLRYGVAARDIQGFDVRCVTLVTLMQEHGLQRCDVLQIDAEAHDYAIVRSIDFEVCAPLVIRFEHQHMSKRQQNECVERLAARGYRFLVERNDLTALRYDA
ncbi:MAG TPA: FkbM family methyltransferase [Gemmatimonadales bacterium]|nr:FkbM family methyltransferase [Gemmatimonadales bacterium]